MSLSPAQARHQLWEQGVLHWLLHPVQKELYDSFYNCNEKIVVWNCSRRLGKSTTLCIIALETCLKTPNALVKYCCAKQKDAKAIVRPIIQKMLETCPKELRPEFKTQEGDWVFKNGSRIQVTGLDGGRAESMRGGDSNLAIIDEAGLVSDLPYIITSIVLPTTAVTKGKIILASTPPKSPQHPFVTRYLNKARVEGNLITKTIFDNPNIEQDEFDKIVEESGGVQSIDFRREYLCEILVDSNYAIIPEFTKELQEKIVQDWPRATFYDSYVSMDVGMKDLTVVLFAWYDFMASKLIVEDEFVINGQKFNTESLAHGIRQKEEQVFRNSMTGEEKPPYLRISDNNLILIKDLWDLHAIRFLPTRKDDADAALNKVRVMIQNEEIIINPRCTVLLAHLSAGIWNKAKTSFDRSADNGHFDAIDSLKYLVRNVQTGKNPYPANYFGKPGYETYSARKPQPENAHSWNQVFGLNKTSTSSQDREIRDILNKRK